MDTKVETPVATPNMELVNEVFAKIEEDLAHWDQGTWTTDADKDGSICNTSFCFGGWALHLKERLRVTDGVHSSRYIYAVDELGEQTAFSAEAAKLLGFNEALAWNVFYNINDDFQSYKAQTLASIEKYGSYTEQQLEAWENCEEVD